MDIRLYERSHFCSTLRPTRSIDTPIQTKWGCPASEPPQWDGKDHWAPKASNSQAERGDPRPENRAATQATLQAAIRQLVVVADMRPYCFQEPQKYKIIKVLDVKKN